MLCSLQPPVAALAVLVPAVKYYTSGQGIFPQPLNHFLQVPNLGSSGNGRDWPIFVTVNKPRVVFLILFLACSWCVVPVFLWNAECIISNQGMSSQGCQAGQAHSACSRGIRAMQQLRMRDEGKEQPESPGTARCPGEISGTRAARSSGDCGGQSVGFRGGGENCTDPCRQRMGDFI